MNARQRVRLDLVGEEDFGNAFQLQDRFADSARSFTALGMTVCRDAGCHWCVVLESYTLKRLNSVAVVFIQSPNTATGRFVTNFKSHWSFNASTGSTCVARRAGM